MICFLIEMAYAKFEEYTPSRNVANLINSARR
jgi:hypothetical protein